jgi:hypothetical protein
MIDFTDLLQQMAVRGDEVTVGDPDGIRRLGDRRRRRTTARWAVTVTVLILAGGTWLVGSDLDHSSTAPPVSHLTPPPTTPSSTTGSTWNAQPLKPPLMFGRKPDLGAKHYALHALTAREDIYVLVGNTVSGGHVWLSPDGSSWAEPFTNNTPKARSLTDVVATDSGFLAVGQDTAHHPAIWRSVDGFVWTPQRLFSPSGLTGLIDGVAASNDGWVAWGTVDGKNTGTDGYIWRSDNGVDWVPPGGQSVFAGPGWQDIWSVQATDLGWTAVGRDESAGFKHSYARWTANTQGEACRGPSPAPDALVMDQATMHLAATGQKGSLTLCPVTGEGLFLAMPE